VVRRIGGGCGALSGVSERKGKGREGGMEEKMLSRSHVRGERDEYSIILTYFMCLLCKENGTILSYFFANTSNATILIPLCSKKRKLRMGPVLLWPCAPRHVDESVILNNPPLATGRAIGQDCIMNL
jgi:hypothetical protein